MSNSVYDIENKSPYIKGTSQIVEIVPYEHEVNKYEAAGQKEEYGDREKEREREKERDRERERERNMRRATRSKLRRRGMRRKTS